MGFLNGKAAVVTGGDRGIGNAIARHLAENGADVAICGRDRKLLEKAGEELADFGVDSLAIVADVTKPADRKRLVKTVLREFGKIDIWVNNAGVLFGGDLETKPDKYIDQTIEVNLTGLIHCTKEVLPALKKSKGILINISSVVGKHAHADLPVYCATKFGVIGFTEAMADELSSDGVRVYAICPTSTDTRMWREYAEGRTAAHVPDDVALEVMQLLKSKKAKSGSAIDVRKHV